MLRFHRILIAYAVAIPLALVLGYLVATPDMTSIAVVGMVLGFLLLPLLIQHCHWLLIFTWNSVFVAAFLPGEMQFWIIFAWMTFGLGLVHLVMGHPSFIRSPELTRPILFLAVVVLVTGKIRGGLGLHMLGSGSYGGKNYFLVLSEIVGFFALISKSIPLVKRARTVKWFFLSGLSQGLSNFLYMLGPTSWVLYYVVSSGSAVGQAAADYDVSVVRRFGGFGPCGSAILCFIMARWGLRGLFDWNKPWRLLLLCLALVASLLSGFRSQFAFLLALVAVQIVTEGLWRSRVLPVVLLLGVLCLAPMMLFSSKMPEAVQRTLAFLPVDVSANVRAETDGSLEWRYNIWRLAWAEVPKYLIIGKGYAIDPIDLFLTGEAARSHLIDEAEAGVVSGVYHSGPLSILMPFGMFGAIAFLWLILAGVKALYCNYRFGEARMKQVNSVLLSYFVVQCLFFFFVFGSLESGLVFFIGPLGLSVSLNGGVCRRPVLARQTSLSSSLGAQVAVS